MYLLSAFINFVKFTEQFCDSYLKDLHERSDALIAQRHDIDDETKEIQENIEEIKCVHLCASKSTSYI